MLGNFQQSNLRIEVNAPEHKIRDSLLESDLLKQWMWPQSFASLSGRLNQGNTFVSSLGLVEIEHRVERVEDNCLRLLLSKGIDGYHEWHWGDGWLQSRLEGVSLLPLNLGQTFSLFRLRQYLSLPEGN
ncbi:hypothetical protein I4641_15120 [Waterburya agarophytonicola K14]|uniref:SRPBCC domain-containing protein n=1 Tax=Waterburya agarophytonicola KI4 TaxID=2874699 RepID=A0A964BT20_9CYAN|nr:hypothetical protein [Waterburya agarophytonicola]MCC0178311.1 hypothetical protein [Waterburya agarophytonicola KI4]